MISRLRACRVALVAIFLFASASASAHDLPKQRVDRTIQIRILPGQFVVEYSLELDDTTIARDLKRLRNDDNLPPDPDEWLDQYGRRVAPLIAASLVLDTPDRPEAGPWSIDAIDRRRELHTIYAFRFRIDTYVPGKYRLRDTNFATSDGISRLGIVADPGIELDSDDEYPTSADREPYRPAWMLNDSELTKTTQWRGTIRWPASRTDSPPPIETRNEERSPALRDHSPPRFWSMRLGLLSALVLGVVHTLQPGHGKTLLATAAVASNGRKSAGMATVAGWFFGHFAVIFLLAGLSLVLSTSSLATVSTFLKKLAGLLIACPAAYRLGEGFRTVTKRFERTETTVNPPAGSARFEANSGEAGGLLLGLTAGMIPCWEAIGLLLLGIAAGHIWTGLGLVAAFVAGSLVVVIGAMLATRLISPILGPNRRSGRILMIGLDMVVLATGVNLLLSSTWFPPFRS